MTGVINPAFIEPIYKEVGARVKWMRMQRGWTQEHLGERLGMHKTTINQWEKAICRIKFCELVRIAHALGAPLEMFLADLNPADAEPTSSTIDARRRMSAGRMKTLAAKKAGKKKSRK